MGRVPMCSFHGNGFSECTSFGSNGISVFAVSGAAGSFRVNTCFCLSSFAWYLSFVLCDSIP